MNAEEKPRTILVLPQSAGTVRPCVHIELGADDLIAGRRVCSKENIISKNYAHKIELFKISNGCISKDRNSIQIYKNTLGTKYIAQATKSTHMLY